MISLLFKHSSYSSIVEGFDKTKRKYATRFSEGAKDAGFFLLEKSQPLVPVDTGELKASGEVWWEGGGFNTVVYVGYTAPHAIYVHERVELNHAYPTQAKFLEDPAERYYAQMGEMVRNSMEGKA